MKTFFTKTGLLLVFLLLMMSNVFAQSPDPFLMDDFEPGGISGAGVSTDSVNKSLPPKGWNCNGHATPSIVPNPNKSGINKSATVMCSIRAMIDASVDWAGPKIDDHDWGPTLFAYTWGAAITGYKYLHIKVYCDKVIKPGANLQVGGGDVAPVEGTVMTPNKWIDVVFDISKYSQVDRINIFVDRTSPLTEDSKVYLDDIILTNNPSPTGINIVAESNVSIYAYNGTLHISGSSEAVAVYNTSGQEVYKNTSAENLSVGLPKGLYIVKVGVVAKKILVQ